MLVLRLPLAIPHLVLAPGGRHHHYRNRSPGPELPRGGVSVLGLRDLWADMVLVSSRARFEFEELVD